jgi:hypothetical protein
MRQYEYRIEPIILQPNVDRESQITESLNGFAHKGWRVVSLAVGPGQSGDETIKVLLERRAKKGEAKPKSVKKSAEAAKQTTAEEAKDAPARTRAPRKRS